jgi:hypothetical protein
MTGRQYADRIAAYLVKNYADRGIDVYREVPLGKTIIGKDRRVDIFVLHRATCRALAIECKFQDSQGTTDEKIPYALEDLVALRIPACLVYAGEGFSPGIRHMMSASHLAAECLPPEDAQPGEPTREFDHILAMTFGWWDLVVRGRVPVRLDSLRPAPARSRGGTAAPAPALAALEATPLLPAAAERPPGAVYEALPEARLGASRAADGAGQRPPDRGLPTGEDPGEAPGPPERL